MRKVKYMVENSLEKKIIANTIIDGNEAVVLWNKIYRKKID